MTRASGQRKKSNPRLQWLGLLAAAVILQGCGAEPSTDSAESALSGPSTVVRDWNLVTLQVVTPPTRGRSWTLVHVAIFDAVNSIERRYQPYAVTAPAAHGASSEAAAIQAA
ncbi:MAG: hypothetical protein ACXWLL_03120, partial [Myxococcaceae bacterium]